MNNNDKRLIVFCDGTWNKPDKTDKNGKACPTHALKLFRATCATDKSGNPQITCYIRMQHVVNRVTGMKETIVQTVKIVAVGFALGLGVFIADPIWATEYTVVMPALFFLGGMLHEATIVSAWQSG